MTGGASPLVSIVIPHFNRPEKLSRTLQSLSDQTMTDWEVIVVDDASSHDPTEVVHAVIPPPRAVVVRLEKNGGPGNARNCGVAVARGRFVAFLDSDDRWEPRKLERQIALALQSPSPDRILCYCRSRILRADTIAVLAPARGIGPEEDPADYLFLHGGFAQTSSLLIGTEAARSFSFDPGLRQYEDYLYFINARAHVDSYLFVDEPLSNWDDEPRADRLSRGVSRSIANSDLFLKHAGARVGARARLAFLITHLGVDILQEQPLRGAALIVGAVLAGSVSLRYGLRQCLRALLGDARFARLRGATP